MARNDNRIAGFDFIRAFAIGFVFLGHIISKQSQNDIAKLLFSSLSPGLTMSVLGFISAYLLVLKYDNFDGSFYVKRLSRIYSSLVVCLLTIVLFHAILSYDVINQHSIVHFLGLSFFMDLLQVENTSSIGIGLWFITTIIILYLLLPLLCIVYRHKYAKIHLIVAIVSCICLNKIMYGCMSAWNVAMAFNIGCYVGLNSNIQQITKKSFYYFLFSTLFILILNGLSTSKILPYETRGFLLPFYPFFAVPLIYKIGNILKGRIKSSVIWFSSISYEVYILHFYFINENFSYIFPSVNSIYLKILIAVIIVLPLAHLLSKIGGFIGKQINNYLLSEQKVSVQQRFSMNG